MQSKKKFDAILRETKYFPKISQRRDVFEKVKSRICSVRERERRREREKNKNIIDPLFDIDFDSCLYSLC